MRRLLAAILLFLFCGCGRHVADAPSSPLAGRIGGYETNASITYRDLHATATIAQPTPDACTVTFSSPESIQDMVFQFGQDSVDVQYKGLHFQYAPESLPDGAIANLAVKALNKAMQDDGVTIEASVDGLELRGILRSGPFTLLFDPQTQTPAKLFVPDAELEIVFDNFRFFD